MRFLLVLGIFLSQACAHAQVDPNLVDRLFRGETTEVVELETIVQEIPEGSVIILGEVHNLVDHHQNQLRFLEALSVQRTRPIHVGLEFLSYPDQVHVDAYLADELSEEDFLKKTGFGSSFPSYRPKILFPTQTGGKTLAINAPRSLSGQVARVGVEGLGPGERELLPPQFELGRDIYYERFQEIMSGGAHPLPPAALKRYFEAQSLWDDTMAWQVKNWRERFPQDDIVIIVGDFHASYGGGLADRLKARGVPRVVSVSQVQLRGLTQQQQWNELRPHSRYGVRADYVWATDSEEE